LHEIDRWAAHVGKIDQDIAFELFVKHADDICAAASRALDTEPNAELTIITSEDRESVSRSYALRKGER
jgi:hypothetical protein